MAAPKFVLDASAAVALVRREAGWDKVDGATRRGATIAASNLAEAITTLKRRGHKATVAELKSGFARLGLGVEDVTGDDVVRMSELLMLSDDLVAKGELERPVSLGDATCIAVAERLGLPVICSDRAWDKLSVAVPVGQFR